MLSVFATMFVFRVGLFREKRFGSTEAMVKEEEIAAPPEE
jgi:hypothetical protein